MDSISFADLGLGEKALQAVLAKGFEVPSPIQVLAIPRLLNGEANLIAKARTGTGKTAAFGLPLVEKITEKKDHPQALVLAPTRELALQVCKEIESLSTSTFPRMAAVYGGQSMRDQLRALKNGVEIVVGTPGRVKDHLDRGSLRLEEIDFFILDEADEMLDMGFIDDIEEIFSRANPESRILLFSATMPNDILKIAGKFMGDYEIIEEEAPKQEELLIDQKYIWVRENEKIEALVRLIDISPDFYGLVFTQTKNDADMVSKQLDERGYEASALHGDIPQNQREKILSRFRNKKTRILVATDVAARGIDIEGLTHVVNFAIPFDGQTYVHRIGRTGRAGARGTAFTMVRPEERRKFDFLRQNIRKASRGEMVEVSTPSVKEVLKVKRHRLFDELKSEILPTEEVIVDPTSENPEKVVIQKELEQVGDNFLYMANQLCDDLDAKDALSRVLQHMFAKELDADRYGHVSDLKLSQSFSKGREGGRFNAGNGDQIRLYVGLGKRDGFNAREIAQYFSDLLNIPQRLVDRIDVARDFSLISVPSNLGNDLVEKSKRDRALPHIHIDTKSDSFGDFGRSDRGDRGGRSRNRSRDNNRRDFDRRDNDRRGNERRSGERSQSRGNERRSNDRSYDKQSGGRRPPMSGTVSMYKKSSKRKDA